MIQSNRLPLIRSVSTKSGRLTSKIYGNPRRMCSKMSSHTDLEVLNWETANRPYKVDRQTKGKKLWKHGEDMPVTEGWKHFNYHFHQLFQKNTVRKKAGRNHILASLAPYGQENGIDILRAGYIKAHNGLRGKVR